MHVFHHFCMCYERECENDAVQYERSCLELAESCGPGVFLDTVLSKTFETLVFMVTGKFEKKKFSFECGSAEFFVLLLVSLCTYFLLDSVQNGKHQLNQYVLR